jgi:hypothetical protein
VLRLARQRLSLTLIGRISEIAYVAYTTQPRALQLREQVRSRWFYLISLSLTDTNSSQNKNPENVTNALQQIMPTAEKTSSVENIELAKLRDGYPALAAWMARDIDDETLIFRRFSNLAARNILHLQAQLIAIEQEILDADAVARGSKEGMVASMRWETLMQRSRQRAQPECKRRQDMERLKGLLNNYCNSWLHLVGENSNNVR